MFEDLNPRIAIRPFKWKTLDHAEANRSMEYAGYEGGKLKTMSIIYLMMVLTMVSTAIYGS